MEKRNVGHVAHLAYHNDASYLAMLVYVYLIKPLSGTRSKFNICFVNSSIQKRTESRM